jgi:diguanylate cyclase (GGDEF)-like protein/PAS domain S-box-containing protein
MDMTPAPPPSLVSALHPSPDRHALLHSVLQAIPDLVWVKDPHGVYLACNPTVERLYGAAAADIVGQTDYDFVARELADFFRQKDCEAAEAGRPSSNEEWLTFAADGYRGLFETVKTPIRDAEGRLIGVLGIARDITEHRALESTLMATAGFVSQHHGAGCFDALVRFAAETFGVDYVHVALLEPDAGRVRVIAAWLDGQRLDPGYVYALAGTPCENVLQQVRKCYGDQVQALFPDDQDLVTLNAEAYIGEPIIDGQGKVAGLIVLVSRRPLSYSQTIEAGMRILAARAGAELGARQADAARRVSEERHRRITSITSDVIYSCYRGPDGLFHIDWCAGKAEDVFGFSNDELMARGCWRCSVVAEDQPLFARNITELQPGQSSDFTVRITHADGAWRWLRSYARVEDDPDARGDHRLHGACQDVTSQHLAEAALRASQQRLRLILDSAAEAIYGADTRGNCTFVNRACLRMLAYDREDDLVGQGMHALIHHTYPDGRPYPREACQVRQATLEGRDTHVDDEVHWRADGTSFPVEYWSHPMYRDGEVAGVVVTFVDISERRVAERALRESEARYRALFEASGDGIVVLSGDTVVDCNDAACRMFRCDCEQMIGQSIAQLSPPQQAGGQSSADRASERLVGARVYEWRHRRFDGTLFDAEVNLTPVRLGDEPHLIRTIRDISERKHAQARIEFLAHHDVLTGLPNRVLLRDRFDQARAFAERRKANVAMLFLDLDNFKAVNDSLGHAVGDELLKAVALRLDGCIRDTDTISREGGDEFLVLLNDMPDPETVERVAGEILLALAQPLQIAGHVLNVGGSIGIALYPDDGRSFDVLLQCADMAMYNAKAAGRNTFRFFDPAMNARVREHMLLQNRLHQALGGNEFWLAYQPKFNIDRKRMTGIEALLRWRDPEVGEVLPGRFVSVAEDCGLIVPIGRWVIETACRQAVAWTAAGLAPPPVSVNLSALQFRHGRLVETVAEVLAQSGLPPGLLELELTESILLHDVDNTLDTVRRLKALGVMLSIDDFGTGYSSLGYLKRLAVDKLKIDQSFVRHVDSDPDAAAIVSAVIQLARSLRLGIVAEGVETEGQLAFLRGEGCTEIQGYLFSPPLPPAEIEALLKA